MENKLIAKANTTTARRAAALMASGLYWTVTENHFDTLPKISQCVAIFNIRNFEEKAENYFSKKINRFGSAKLSIEDDKPDQALSDLINSTGINASHLPKNMVLWVSPNSISVSLSPNHVEIIYPESESVFC